MLIPALSRPVMWMLVGALACLAVGAYFLLGRAGPPSVAIVAPADGSTVPVTMSAKGTAKNVPAGTNLWTIASTGGASWPQRQAVVVGEEWTSEVSFGGDPGTPFELIVASVTPDAEQVILAWMERGERDKNYVGMPALPAGITPLARVKVRKG